MKQKETQIGVVTVDESKCCHRNRAQNLNVQTHFFSSSPFRLLISVFCAFDRCEEGREKGLLPIFDVFTKKKRNKYKFQNKYSAM